jgi:hypothetical protein
MAQQTETHELTTGTVPPPPPEVELGDGSRLVLVDAASSPIVTRIESDRITLDDAMRRGLQPFAGYRRLK